MKIILKVLIIILLSAIVSYIVVSIPSGCETKQWQGSSMFCFTALFILLSGICLAILEQQEDN